MVVENESSSLTRGRVAASPRGPQPASPVSTPPRDVTGSIPGERRTLRQQRADETRGRLFAAAVELFRKDGYHGTSVHRIAAKAGVAKGTFFVHYPSKEAVIAELVSMQTMTVRATRAHALSTGKGPVEALRASVLTLGEVASISRSLSRGVLAAVLASQDVGGSASALFETVFEDMQVDAHAAKAAGLLAPRVSPETLAQSLMASYLGAVLHFTSTPHAKPLLETLLPLIDATLEGALRPAKSGSKRDPVTAARSRKKSAPGNKGALRKT